MIAEALQWVRKMADEASGIEDHDEGAFSTVKLHRLPKEELDYPVGIQLASLTGLVDFLLAHAPGPGLQPGQRLIHVASPWVVAVLGPLDERRRRAHYASARAVDATQDFLGAWHDQEQFVLALLTAFEDTVDRAAILKIVGSLRDESVCMQEDDGVSQTVTTRKGVASLKDTPVPNPVTLTPYRTFREIDQPTSPFILRIKRREHDAGISKLTLLEAAGDHWHLAAIERIRGWLDEKLTAAGLTDERILA